MKKRMIAIVLLGILLSGCNNYSSYNKYMEEGENAIKNEDYNKASENFQNALIEKPSDEEAEALEEQVITLIKSIEYKNEQEYDEAINLCYEIKNIKSKNKIVIEVAEKIEQESQDEKENFEQYKNNLNNQISEIRALFKNGIYIEAKNKINKIISQIDNNKQLDTQLKEVNIMLDECNEHINNLKTYNEENTEESGVFNGDIAIKYLKKYYNIEDDGDTIFDYKNNLQYSPKGKYYEVVMKSKSRIENGEDGVIWWFKVYEDESIET